MHSYMKLIVLALAAITSAQVSQISDGQPQAATTLAPVATVTTQPAPVSEFTDGQPQAPTSVVVSNITSPTLTPFKGAASGNNANQIVAGMAVGIAAALML